MKLKTIFLNYTKVIIIFFVLEVNINFTCNSIIIFYNTIQHKISQYLFVQFLFDKEVLKKNIQQYSYARRIYSEKR